MEAVEACIGTPVVHYGRKPGAALDCVGLPWAACVACGMDMPATASYGARPSEDELTAGLSQFCDEVDGDGHLWQVMHGRQARHVVVPVGVNDCGQPLVIHAWAKGRVVRRVVWESGAVRHWRIRGVE